MSATIRPSSAQPGEEIELPAIVDAHVHFRQDDLADSPGMCSRIAHYSGMVCDHVIVMPNTKPPIHDPDRIAHMRGVYKDAVGHPTTIHMVAKWLPRTTPADVLAAKAAGVIGFKLYPQGATTNSDDGIPFSDLMTMDQRMQDVLGAMEAADLVLMCHGEAPGYVMNRESLFLPWFTSVTDRFPNLRLTLEHITSVAGVDQVALLHKGGRRVMGTITLHHMMRTLDDVIGGKLKPDEFCMPVPKSPQDRNALLYAALKAEPCFALGSDSAPHEQRAKYCREGCAGVFTAPVLLQSLLELFGDDMEALHRFTVGNASAFYGFEPSGRKVVLKKTPFHVPATAGLVTSFRSLETIPWTLKRGA